MTNNSQKLGTADKTNHIYLKVGEGDTENIYISMFLNQEVAFGNSFNAAIDNLVKNNEFKHTATLLKNTDNLNDIDGFYGPEVNLEETVFYQDILATKISNNYGLNLRNKDFFTIADTKFIKFKAYTSDDYLTEIIFEESKDGVGYKFYDENLDDVKFKYTDSDGNEFAYFAVSGQGKILVYKNKEYVGLIKINHRGGIPEDLFGELNYVFGTK